ncbi:MAG TPA: hypothetical protein VFR12_13730 [Pyrinomonadaceae bacterium]|nr:hypothetical protein [Pyrinomonadaceae bacterium]
MAVTITATKSGRRGRPAVEIAFDPGTKLEDILAAQRRVFADKGLAKKIGLKFCDGCYSGLDLDIRQKYENVI